MFFVKLLSWNSVANESGVIVFNSLSKHFFLYWQNLCSFRNHRISFNLWQSSLFCSRTKCFKTLLFLFRSLWGRIYWVSIRKWIHMPSTNYCKCWCSCCDFLLYLSHDYLNDNFDDFPLHQKARSCCYSHSGLLCWINLCWSSLMLFLNFHLDTSYFCYLPGNFEKTHLLSFQCHFSFSYGHGC